MREKRRERVCVFHCFVFISIDFLEGLLVVRFHPTPHPQTLSAETVSANTALRCPTFRTSQWPRPMVPSVPNQFPLVQILPHRPASEAGGLVGLFFFGGGFFFFFWSHRLWLVQSELTREPYKWWEPPGSPGGGCIVPSERQSH